jgi:hypothetical protein
VVEVHKVGFALIGEAFALRHGRSPASEGKTPVHLMRAASALERSPPFGTAKIKSSGATRRTHATIDA